MARKTFAVITGASSGLGKALAYELASLKNNLLLIALPGEGLSTLAQELMNYGIEVYCYETDLTQRANVEAVALWINQNYEVSILINNAGIGGTKKFDEADLDYIYNIIQLNVTSTSLMTKLLLSNLMRQEKAYILNVSSMAAFTPMGYKTVYPASKAFVHHFTRGLYEELKSTNVFVSVVNPGPMKTNQDVSERIQRQGIFARIGLLSPEEVAKRSIKQLFKRDTMIMLGLGNGFNWLMMKIVPIWIRLPLVTRAVKREIEMSTQIL